MLLQTVLKDISDRNHYPENAIIQFEGYSSFEDKSNLIDALKDSAFKFGTVLVNQRSYSKSANKKYYSCTLACAHYGVTNTSSVKVFKPNYVQACGSIIQETHYASSTKNRSRNSTFQRAHSSTDKKMKSSRTNTSKCRCSFQFSIFFCHTSSKWYLKKRFNGIKSQYMYHVNHIYVDPKYLTTKKNSLSSQLIHEINCMMETGTKLSAVSSLLQSRYKINVSYQTLYNMRMNKIKDLLKQCSKDPYGTPVNRLINIFTNTENVSFVYILHRKDSGFVTFRRNRNESIQQYVNSVNIRESTGFSERSIQDWRDELSLSDSNHILVAFAWAHDEELKSTEMYPEYLAADVTFGVNRERRELFLVAGIDGRHRVFTSFRCFIPSKQEHSYTWIINQAMPHLLSNKVFHYNQLICTDNELNMNNAVKTSIDSPKPAFYFSKFRLDCYHFHKKVWYDKIIPSSEDTLPSRNVLKTVNSWIMSWFKIIESTEELYISHSVLMKYFNSKTDIVRVACAELTVKHITKILSSKEQLLHPFFKDVSSFEFISDSIVESANNPIKNGIMGVSNAMEISNSGLQQVKSTVAKSLKEDVSSAQRINFTMTWTNSLTKDYLTDYAEGLSCKNFDRRKLYDCRYIGNHEWLVCYNHLFADDYTSAFSNIKPTKFLRVRKVWCEGGHMSCTCCYEKRMLMPCVHMCSVIDDPSLYTADLFHIRWWKHFYFLYKTKVSETNRQSYEDLKQSLNHVRDNHFSKTDGKYKGIPIMGTKFGIHLNSSHCTQMIRNDDHVFNAMMSIHNMDKRNIPLRYGSNDWKKYLTKTRSDSLSLSVSEDNDSDDKDIETNSFEIEDMGAGSQVFSQRSEYRDNLDTKTVSTHKESTDICSSSFYSQLHPTFSELASKIKTEDQLQEAQDLLQKLSFKFSGDTMKDRKFSDGDITFLGEIAGDKRPEKRFKSRHER